MCQKQCLRSTKQCLASSPSEKRLAAAGGSWRHNSKILENFLRGLHQVNARRAQAPGGHSVVWSMAGSPLRGFEELLGKPIFSSTDHAAAVAASWSSAPSSSSSKQVSERIAWPSVALLMTLA